MLFLHNLGTSDATVDRSEPAAKADNPMEVFADRPYRPVGGLDKLELAGYGYRWIRLHRNPAG